MTNSELIKDLSIRLDKPQTEIKSILKSSTKIMKNLLDKDLIISIPGLGTFKSFVKKERKSFNPQQKSFMLIPPKRVIKFNASSSIKKELKNRRI